MSIPPALPPKYPKPHQSLWQRYIKSSLQQRIIIPLGALVLLAILGKMVSQAATDLKAVVATDTLVPTFTLTISPPTLTSTSTLVPTITLSPTITDTPTVTFTPTVTNTSTKTYTPTVTMTPTLTLPAAEGSACVPVGNNRVKARVVRITDGDTIVVNINGVEYKLRYIGMDSPEPGTYGSSQATYYNTQLVLGKTVTLVKDVSETDRYDRLLRYVFVGDIFVNYEIIRAGYATSGSWPPDTSCDNVFLAANATARSNKLGNWKPTPVPYVPPIPLIIQPTKASGGNCDPAYPTVCIPPPPPDLDCKDISFRRFQVLAPDPHNFDADHDGIGCES